MEDSSTVDPLEDFRERWQQEIEKTTEQNRNERNKSASFLDEGVDEDETKARTLFLQGTELERLGKAFEAMRLYRRAIQIVPDIEFKIYESSKKILESPSVDGKLCDCLLIEVS